MHSKPNWRFLLKLAAVLIVAGITVHLVHRWQVRSQVGVFLQHADAARDAGDGEREESFLRRYVRARPSDLDARERLARRVCANAKSGKAMVEGYLLVEDVLRRDPKRDDLRRYAIDFAMDPQLGMFSQAQANIDYLLHKDNQPEGVDPNTQRQKLGELEALYARCSTAQGKYAGDENGAVERYKKAIQLRPDLVDAYGARAFILRLHLNRAEEADETIVGMIEKNPDKFRTHLLLAQYWRTFFEDPNRAAVKYAEPVAKAQKLNQDTTVAQAAEKAVAAAQKLAQDELDVMVLAAYVARDRGRALARQGKEKEIERKQAFAEARQLLDGGIAKHPKSPNVYLAMAELVAEIEKPSAAVEVVRKGLAAVAATDSTELALALLDYQVLAGDAAGAAKTLDSLRSKGLAQAQADYQQARVLALEEKWLEASRVLERTRQDVPNNPGLARQINLLLGRCFEQLGEDDRRLDAYRQALPVDPTDPLWVPAVLGIAEAEAALGRVDDALTTYRKLKDRAPGAWVQVARLEMIRALAVPKEQRDWRASEEALKQAEGVLPDATDVLILRADLLHFQGKPAEARKRLEDLGDKRPKEAAVWVALATQDLRDKKPTQAAATLDAAEKAAGDSPDLRLTRARLWAGDKKPELADKLKKLADGSEAFPRAQRRRLLSGLAQIATTAGVPEAASSFWGTLAELRPDDLGVRLVHFDQAVRAGDAGAIDRTLEEIRRIDGKDGSSARLAEAMALIWRAQHKAEPAGLDKALSLLDGLVKERAGSGRVALGQAMAHDLKRDTDAAIAKYQEAVESGAASPAALRRLMQLLYAKGRIEEAAEVLRKIPDVAAASPEVQRLAANVSLRTDDPELALEYAQRAVPPDSKDPLDHIWLGGVYEAAGERAKADASFRKAVNLRPESADGWLVLVQYLAATGRRAEAEKALDEGGGKVSSPDRALFQALGHARLGQTAKAAAAFERARTQRPDDLRTAQAEATYLFQLGRLAEAGKAFERVIGLPSASPEDKESARQMFAISLAADPNYETSRKALELLGPLQGGGGSAADQQTPARRRSRAIVLALQKDRGSKQEAIRLLEGLREAMTPSDRFLLVQLHAAVGNRPQVRVVLAELLQKADTVPLYVAYYAGWLLREGDIGAAQDWVKRLEQIQPDALQTAELKARLAAARKDLKTARAVLLQRAEAKGAPIARIAAVCEEVGLYEDAEGLLKRFGEENKKTQPRAVLALAAFYGRRGRTADALQICDSARSAVPAPVVGQVAVGALYANPAPAAADVSRVAGWLQEAAGVATGDARGVLIQQLASVRNLQGNYAESVALYTQAIAANRRDALAMNNLAYLLSAHEDKHDDALRLLEQAKLVLGPSHPDLLDTEALVRLNKGEADAAQKLLEGVVAQAPTGTAYFHLAQAEQKLNRDLEARLAWRKSEELSLQRAELHPLERRDYDDMAKSMK